MAALIIFVVAIDRGALPFRFGAGMHFGPGFREALNSGYLLAASHPTGPGSYWTHDVWRPRP
jgi:hypothetical protein